METYTKAQIIEIIYRQQGDDESLIKRLSEKIAQKISDDELKEQAKNNDIPLKSLGYNRYYIA